MILLLPFEKLEMEEAKMYVPVSTMFDTPVIVYLIFNLFALIMYGLDFKFKGEKGILRVLKKIMLFWPLFVTFILAWIFSLRLSFVG
jgi:uncharacterized membrane protein YsdA (DUF1294 family)